MTDSSEDEGSIPQEFKDEYGLDDDWGVRFTADKLRAHEMAVQYQEMGLKVRVLPLQPQNEMLDTEELKQFSDNLDLDHDPLQYLEDDSCNTCLDQTYVVFTKENSAAEPTTADNDEFLYEHDA